MACSFPFLHLPNELRNKVYALILPEDKDIFFEPGQSKKGIGHQQSKRSKIDLDLLLVCKQINHEARAFLFNANFLHLNVAHNPFPAYLSRIHASMIAKVHIKVSFGEKGRRLYQAKVDRLVVHHLPLLKNLECLEIFENGMDRLAPFGISERIRKTISDLKHLRAITIVFLRHHNFGKLARLLQDELGSKWTMENNQHQMENSYGYMKTYNAYVFKKNVHSELTIFRTPVTYENKELIEEQEASTNCAETRPPDDNLTVLAHTTRIAGGHEQPIGQSLANAASFASDTSHSSSNPKTPSVPPTAIASSVSSSKTIDTFTTSEYTDIIIPGSNRKIRVRLPTGGVYNERSQSNKTLTDARKISEPLAPITGRIQIDTTIDSLHESSRPDGYRVLLPFQGNSISNIPETAMPVTTDSKHVKPPKSVAPDAKNRKGQKHGSRHVRFASDANCPSSDQEKVDVRKTGVKDVFGEASLSADAHSGAPRQNNAKKARTTFQTARQFKKNESQEPRLIPGVWMVRPIDEIPGSPWKAPTFEDCCKLFT